MYLLGDLYSFKLTRALRFQPVLQDEVRFRHELEIGEEMTRDLIKRMDRQEHKVAIGGVVIAWR